MLSNSALLKVLIVIICTQSASSRKNKIRTRPMLRQTTNFYSTSMILDSPSLGAKSVTTPPMDFLHLDFTGNLRALMFKNLRPNNFRDSVTFSPYTALLSLGQMLLGSSSRNHKELKLAAGIGRRAAKYKFREMMYYLKNTSTLNECAQVSIASLLFASTRYASNFDFELAMNNSYFYGCFHTVDYGDYDDALLYINKVTKEHLRFYQMSDVIDLDELTATEPTSIVITNGMTFHGYWEFKFDLVREGMFHAPGKDIKLTMMTVKGIFNYTISHTHAVEVIQIPYSGYQASLVIILPFNNHLYAHKKDIYWNKVFGVLDRTRLQVTIPKFMTRTVLDFVEVLKGIGMKDIFDPMNNVLTKIMDNTRVHISAGKHVGVMEVSERYLSSTTHKPDQSIHYFGYRVINVDRPFYYIVTENHQQLMAGWFNGYPYDCAKFKFCD